MSLAEQVAVCVGKFPHATKRAALLIARRMRHKAVRVYRCQHCHAWHIGSTTPKATGK